MAVRKRISFWLNDKYVDTCAADPNMRAATYLRSHQRMTGTKIGCQEGDCGACAVLLGEPCQGSQRAPLYRAALSCILPLAELDGRHVVTIEGLTLPGPEPLPLAARLLREFGAVQCGFCSPGFVIALTAGLLAPGEVSAASLERAAEGNVCRCTGYRPIHSAIRALAERYGTELSSLEGAQRLRRLGEREALPPYFIEVALALPPSRPDSPWPAQTASIIGGGTDLLVDPCWPLQRGEDDAALFQLTRQAALRGIHEENGEIVIGAATRIDDLGASPLTAGIFSPALALVASEPVRRQATVAGNLVHASPIGDLSVMLLALRAKLLIRGADGGERALPLARFFMGYRHTALEPGEVVTQIRLPALIHGGTSREVFHFEKVSTRKYLDIATVNTALRMTVAGSIIVSATASAGGVAPTPLLLERAASHLVGKALSANLLREAAALAVDEAAPISDVRGSAAYKRRLLGRLFIAHFTELFAHDPSFVRGLIP